MKTPTRLADFQIPRGEEPTPDQISGQPAPTLVRTPPPATEPVKALGARVPLSITERLRDFLWASRRSQQDVVTAALDEYLKKHGA
jgi:hypothetical protein